MTVVVSVADVVKDERPVLRDAWDKVMAEASELVCEVAVDRAAETDELTAADVGMEARRLWMLMSAVPRLVTAVLMVVLTEAMDVLTWVDVNTDDRRA